MSHVYSGVQKAVATHVRPRLKKTVASHVRPGVNKGAASYQFAITLDLALAYLGQRLRFRRFQEHSIGVPLAALGVNWRRSKERRPIGVPIAVALEEIHEN